MSAPLVGYRFDGGCACTTGRHVATSLRIYTHTCCWRQPSSLRGVCVRTQLLGTTTLSNSAARFDLGSKHEAAVVSEHTSRPQPPPDMLTPRPLRSPATNGVRYLSLWGLDLTKKQKQLLDFRAQRRHSLGQEHGPERALEHQEQAVYVRRGHRQRGRLLLLPQLPIGYFSGRCVCEGERACSGQVMLLDPSKNVSDDTLLVLS